MITEDAHPEVTGAPQGEPASQPASNGRALWHNRDFNIFWTGQGLSAVGDAFSILALPLLVLQATGSVSQMGLVTGTFGAGQLLSGVFAGAIVDKLDRRRLMIVCDLGRAILHASIPLGWWLGGPQIWLIYVAAGLGAVLGNTFQVANITAVANLVDKEQITDANGRMQATYGVSFLVGPMLAGTVSNQFGPATALGIDAVSFVISAISIALIRLRPRQEPDEAQGARQEKLLEALLAGVRYMWREPVLRWLSILLAAMSFISFAGNDLYVYLLKHNLGQSDNMVGVLFGLASLGSIAGSLVASRLRRRWGFAACWLVGTLVSGVGISIIGLAPYLVVIIPAAMVLTGADSIRGIMSVSLRQEITPDHLLGRVTAAFWAVITVPGPLGAAVMTIVAERTSAPLAILMMGVGCTVCAVVAYFTPIRRQHSGRVQSPS